MAFFRQPGMEIINTALAQFYQIISERRSRTTTRRRQWTLECDCRSGPQWTSLAVLHALHVDKENSRKMDETLCHYRRILKSNRYEIKENQDEAALASLGNKPILCQRCVTHHQEVIVSNLLDYWTSSSFRELFKTPAALDFPIWVSTIRVRFLNFTNYRWNLWLAGRGYYAELLGAVWFQRECVSRPPHNNKVSKLIQVEDSEDIMRDLYGGYTSSLLYIQWNSA